MKKKVVAFDLDGILAESEPALTWERDPPVAFYTFYQASVPNAENIELLNRLQATKKYKIVIYTARVENFREVTEAWLKKHEVRYDCLVMSKMYFDALLDDRSASTKEGLLKLLGD